MRSKASVKGHPIHPMLIAFPVGFIVGALIFDVLGYSLDNRTFNTTGSHLLIAGVISGLLAAVPGIIDYLYTVPPRSSGKRRATIHALINVTALILTFTAWLLRPDTDTVEGTQLFLELLAVGFLSVGGYLGGTLVYRNQIGVDHRYAEAGKWKELVLDDWKGEPVEVSRIGELEVNQMKLVRLGGQRIVVARTEEGYAAFDDHCTHKGGSLAGGQLCEGTVMCPWHGSQFSIHTGEVKAGPAKKPIGTYQISVHDGRVMLEIQESDLHAAAMRSNM